MTATTLDPKTALIVVDLQKGIVGASTVHPAGDVVANAATLADAFRAKGLPVVLVRVTGGAPGRTEGDAARSGQRPPADWADIVPEIGPREGDIVVTKQQWGAFHGTDLDLQLRRRGVTQVVLTGIATAIGVESTARAAHEHGYHVTVATDAVTDLDADTHRTSVEKIFPRLGETDTTAAIVKLLG
ncbi:MULTISPECIES: isochorismatase family protein [unclassified Streptomyces]|uniref:isochorismatase family protein n=1 Tax=Streptomyces TaxID=1883 RepID=UPI0001C1CFA4|nr:MULTISPECIES: isochorismatase family protein [unclassified Streptomyces]AEN12174.1 isochorismatase hydrolase [Streptomyces sp. SirexAA-E]MYR68117.1 isochorismatase family protein [Streptomyces sp. SID4939]MYS01276.1 isochorismatase family protein [Streptomyces sp. SID4940]MYT63285.1 isochorismatase family protein [Streptomyces sp. SID8357]MYT88439.1 isochorismatase family protein [Streptomyces sp. SID8360]